MEEEDAVAGFEAASDNVSALAAIYELSARGVNAFLPEGGHVVDVGCGSGEFLRYVAERRPDARVLGIDLSGPMLTRARARIERAGMADRVSVVQADATELPEAVLPERIDVLTCLNLLHQFPDMATLDRCIRRLADLREGWGCGIWVLDLVRLRRPDTMRRLLEVFEPDMEPIAIKNTLESEAAALTVDELRERFAVNGMPDLRVGTQRPLGSWQVHWSPPADAPPPATDRWVDAPLRLPVRLQTMTFTGLPRGL